MTARVQMMLVGPVGVMLAVHVALLVLWERGVVPKEGWLGELFGPLNLAGAVAVLMAAGWALRRVNAEGEGAAGRGARVVWGVAAIDLVITAAVGAGLWAM